MTTPRRKLSDFFSREEITTLTTKSDWQGAKAVGFTWLVISTCFALMALWPNPLTWLVAIVIIGGRQLALAILAHEATHRTLFKTPWLNDFVGDWLCARLVWLDVPRYREHHMRHHAHTGTERDPDMSLVRPFPTSAKGLRKKLLRDLTGQTGLRRLIGNTLMDAGVLGYTVAADVVKLPQQGRTRGNQITTALRNMTPMLLTNALLWAALAACGIGWAYCAWVIAYLTTFSLFLRLRSLAEHACTEVSPDMFRNTRTCEAGLVARMTVAPHRVNYHLEHHVMASVPFYRLPEMHALLRERGIVPAPGGYREVLRLVSAG